MTFKILYAALIFIGILFGLYETIQEHRRYNFPLTDFWYYVLKDAFFAAALPTLIPAIILLFLAMANTDDAQNILRTLQLKNK